MKMLNSPASQICFRHCLSTAAAVDIVAAATDSTAFWHIHCFLPHFGRAAARLRWTWAFPAEIPRWKSLPIGCEETDDSSLHLLACLRPRARTTERLDPESAEWRLDRSSDARLEEGAPSSWTRQCRRYRRRRRPWNAACGD